MSLSGAKISNHMLKPTSKINFKPLVGATIAAAGAAAVIDDDSDHKLDTQQIDYNKLDASLAPADRELNLWQFSRLYTIGEVPVIDFLIVYIILYLLNFMCSHYNYKFVLLATIPITIILNIFVNNKMKCTGVTMIILVISIYLLLSGTI